MSAGGAKFATDVDPTAHLPRSASSGIVWPLRLIAWICAVTVLSAVVIVPLDVWSQTLFATMVFVIAWMLSLLGGRYVTLALVTVSVTVSFRYLYWRISTTVGNEDGLDMTLGFVLLFAECYAVLVLLLGYVQTSWPLRRRPLALPADTNLWPSVDIYIPTYNEPLSVVRTTVFAAKALDWPADKLNIYVLDDGQRDVFRRFCEEVGVGYIIRPDNKHAKAGNINHALKKTRGDLIAIFDCDHIPTRSFLQLTVGWFVADPKLALVQTPHHFYTPDPFEKNLRNFRKIPNEGELFYGIIQQGNDLWDATFFCGSCAVIRRGPLEEVGGIAPETVTEDAHTMLKLHRRGYRAAYIDVPQAAGLATESLSGHVGQRIRWARGMAQIFRVDNPFLGRGLSFIQRCCYSAAMLHFFYGIPRLIFLMAPLAYLVFGSHIFNASADMIMAYALPHMAHAYLTNSRIQGAHRHSFWAEVYEATLATYIIYPTTLALISPKLGKFNVTAKGGVVAKDHFDARIAAPYIVLLALNLTGIGFGIWRATTPDAEISAIAINLAWSAYGLLFITAAIAVAWEKRQLRVTPRVNAALPATLWTGDQHMYAGQTHDFSTGGMSLSTAMSIPGLQKGDTVEVAIGIEGVDCPASARVITKSDRLIRLEFIEVPLTTEEALVRAVFGRPDAWLDWRDGRRRDRPWLSLLTVFYYGLVGLTRLPRALFKSNRVASILAACVVVFGGYESTHAQPAPEDSVAAEPADPVDGAAAPPAGEAITRTFASIGLDEGTRKYNRSPSVRMSFFARADTVFTSAQLEIAFDKSVTPPTSITGLRISMNDEQVALLPISSADRLPETFSLAIAPQLLGEKNALSLDFVLADGLICNILVDRGSWMVVKSGSLTTTSAPLPLPLDLSMLPLPFYDPYADVLSPVNVVFGAVPTAEDIQTATLIASYFGFRAGARFRFPAHIGVLPADHAVVFVTPKTAHLVPTLGPIKGPMLAMREHPDPSLPHARLLVIAGRTPAEVALAAKRLTLDFEATLKAKETLAIDYAPSVEPRKPWDAPRWITVDAPVKIGSFASKEIRTFRGALGGSIVTEFRIPPTVFTWPRQYVELDLELRVDVPPGVPEPELVIEFNSHYVATLSVPSDFEARRRIRKTLRLPTTEVRGFNRLFVHVVPAETGICPNPKEDLVEVEILPDSLIKLDGFPSFRPMPDLEAFVDDGFPFTRMADLSETLLVLPPNPQPGEIATALSFVAQTTAITGHPATGIEVRLSSELSTETAGDRDIMFIGVGPRLRVLAPFEATLPLRGVTTGEIRIPSIPWTRRVLAFMQGQPLDTDIARLGDALRPGDERSYVLGLESPFSAGRTVVVIAGDTDSVMPSLPELRGFATSLRRDTDLLIKDGDVRTSFRVLDGYEFGTIPPYTRFLWFVARYWVLLVPSLLVTALLLAWVMRKHLANREYQRLSLGIPERNR